MEIKFDKINLTDIGVYTAIVAILFFALRQYLSTAVSEKVKIGFSKELAEFEAKQQRSSAVSLQHREVERQAIIELHTSIVEHVGILYENLNPDPEQLNDWCLKKLEQISDDRQKVGFQSSKIELLIIDEKLVDVSLVLVAKVFELGKAYEEILWRLAMLSIRYKRELPPHRPTGQMDSINKSISETFAEVREHRKAAAAAIGECMSEYKKEAKRHLLV